MPFCLLLLIPKSLEHRHIGAGWEQGRHRDHVAVNGNGVTVAVVGTNVGNLSTLLDVEISLQLDKFIRKIGRTLIGYPRVNRRVGNVDVEDGRCVQKLTFENPIVGFLQVQG